METIMRKSTWVISVIIAAAVAAGVLLYPQGGKAYQVSAPKAVVGTPASLQLTTSSEEQDYPAIAESGDNVYVAYVEFVHSDRSLEARKTFDTAPKSFDFLARPAGGDQVLLLTYSKSARSWSAPVAVSAPKQDIMRTAVAVDGQKRVWVFWSANKNGNFDIYAKSLAGGKWSGETRLSTDPGMDVTPVAATDAKGRVWVAWQGFRNNNLEILAAAQNGNAFTREAIVSFSPQSDWDAAIATAPNGEVAVSWDTYDKGDYDVYFRRLKMDGQIQMEQPVAVAASQNFEARSSIAYDSQSRLWVAYEASTIKWGKDFGAYETTGVSLYQNHNVSVKCFQGAQAFTTAANLAGVLPTGGGKALRREGLQSEGPEIDKLPNPATAAKNRVPSAPAKLAALPLNSFPRIAADPGGTIYLSFRTPIAGQSSLGSIWVQNLTYFDGAKWNGPVNIPNSDTYLDSRAAMAAIAPGDLMMIVTSDHRTTRAVAGARKQAQ